MTSTNSDKCIVCNNLNYQVKWSTHVKWDGRDMGSEAFYVARPKEPVVKKHWDPHRQNYWNTNRQAYWLEYLSRSTRGVLIRHLDILKHFVIFDDNGQAFKHDFLLKRPLQSEIEIENLNKKRLLLKDGSWLHAACFDSLLIQKIFVLKRIIDNEEIIKNYQEIIKKINSFFGVLRRIILDRDHKDTYWVNDLRSLNIELRELKLEERRFDENISAIASGLNYEDFDVVEKELNWFQYINQTLKDTGETYGNSDVANQVEKREEALISSMKSRINLGYQSSNGFRPSFENDYSKEKSSEKIDLEELDKKIKDLRSRLK